MAPLQQLRRIGLADKLLLLGPSREKFLADPTVSYGIIDPLSLDALIVMTLNPASREGPWMPKYPLADANTESSSVANTTHVEYA